MFFLEDKSEINEETKQILCSAIKQNEKVLYMNYLNDVLTTVCLNSNNQAYIRESSIKQTKEICTYFNNFEMKDIQIDYAFVEGGDGFLLYRNPLIIFYITTQNLTPIKLTLSTEVKLQTCLFQLNSPNITIYGNKYDSPKGEIYEISLETLIIKTINDGKGYSPGPRTQSLNILVDGRIYIFGGRDLDGKDCDKMIWVYDLEKGYWFALQMEYPCQQDFRSCQTVILSSSKVLIRSRKSGKCWILQIHQSRLTEIEGNLQTTGQLKCVKEQLVSVYSGKIKIENKRIKSKKK